MAKIGVWLEKGFATVLGILGLLFGMKALRGKGEGDLDALTQARQDQKAQDSQKAQDDIRQVAIRNEEKRQADIKTQIDQVNAQLDSEKKRIEGLDRDAVASELRSMDVASTQPTPATPDPAPPGPAIGSAIPVNSAATTPKT